MNVLIVDEYRCVATTFEQVFKASGFNAAACTTFEEAREFGQQNPPDFAVLGAQSLEQNLRLLAETKSLAPSCKVIFMTGDPDIFKELRDIEGDIPDLKVLPKPSHPSEVIRTMRDAARENGSERRAA